MWTNPRRFFGQKRFRDRFAPFLKPLKPPTSGMFDAPTRCVEINVLWIPYIIGALNALTFEHVWDGDETEQFNTIQQVGNSLHSL